MDPVQTFLVECGAVAAVLGSGAAFLNSMRKMVVSLADIKKAVFRDYIHRFQSYPQASCANSGVSHA